MKQNPHRYHNL